jgi:dienelactone hydrolase
LQHFPLSPSPTTNTRLPNPQILNLTRPRTQQKVGAVGYCFGGKYVIRHLRPDQGKFDASFTAHPSFVDDAEVNDLKGPLSIAAAETDAIFPSDKRHHTEDLLKNLGFPYQINLYAGVEHGFAVRGDVSDQRKMYAKEAAFLQAVQWFDYHLKGEALDEK